MKTLRQINKDNKESLKLLDETTRDALEKLIGYMHASSINEYDAAQIGSDLIAIVLDARGRGETIDDVLGEDKEAFCRQLMEGARRKTLPEKLGYLLQIPFAFLLCDTLFYLFLTPMGVRNRVNPTVPITADTLVSISIFAFFVFLYRCLYTKIAYKSSRLRMLFLFAFIGLYIFTRQFTNILNDSTAILFHINYFTVGAGTVLLFAAATAARYLHTRPEKARPGQSPLHP